MHLTWKIFSLIVLQGWCKHLDTWYILLINDLIQDALSLCACLLFNLPGLWMLIVSWEYFNCRTIPRPFLQLHQWSCLSGTDVAWHSYGVLSNPTQSTRCQLRLGLINEFMRCKGFVRMCAQRCGVLNTNEMPQVPVGGTEGSQDVGALMWHLQEFCTLWFAWQTTVYWFLGPKQSAC